VFSVEYSVAASTFCPTPSDNSHNISAIKKSLDLTALPYTDCRAMWRDDCAVALTRHDALVAQWTCLHRPSTHVVPAAKDSK
jgi:hypothetical protein